MTEDRKDRRASAGMTLAEKLIARAAGQPRVAPGDIATVGIDLAMAHDSSGPRRWQPMLDALGAKLLDPSRVVLVSDHYVPAVDAASAGILAGTRRFAAEHGVERFHDMEGICHVILPERGYLRPGMMLAGGDSHSTMAGAYGCFMAGYGATDMLGIVVTGRTWMQVPDSLLVRLDGSFGPRVTPKDVMLRLCRDLGMDNAGFAIEFAGAAVDAMDMPARAVLTNMAAELGADTGLIGADETTLADIAAHGGTAGPDALSWRSDADAAFARTHVVDVARLAPQVAAPHAPSNSADIGGHAGVRIDQAYIGACVGARLGDLAMAAEILRGRRIARGARLLVAPASARITEAAARLGILTDLLAAGATLLPSGCGACAGMGAGVLAAGETCISTTNRNFKGRMGSGEARVYLASPYTVAASALAGRIADPRAVTA